MIRSATTSDAAPATLLPLRDAVDPSRCGDKAARLARMLGMGLNVPDGVVVPAEVFEGLLDAGPLRTTLDRIFRDLDAQEPRSFRDGARRFRQALMDQPLPVALREGLPAALHRRSGPWIARSSALGEDSEDASYAGQLDSLGDQHTPEQVVAAVAEVWASFGSERSLFSQHTRPRLRGLAVVVQQMVTARRAGVLFSVSPTGDRRHMVLEFCRGAGERLVSGAVEPGRWRIDRETGDAVEEQPFIEPESEQSFSLDHATVAELTSLAHRLEAEFGGPQDIEWVTDSSGALHLVQSRPITALRPSTGEAPSLRTLCSDHLHRWTNANLVENYPGPVCPLLASIARDSYHHYFETLGRAFGVSERRLRAMQHPLRNLVGLHAGFLYYDLSNVHDVLRMAPGGDRLARAFNAFTGTAGLHHPAPRRCPWHEDGPRLARSFESLRVVLAGAKSLLRVESSLRRFERCVQTFADHTCPARLPHLDDLELRDAVAGFLEIRMHRWRGAALSDASAMISYSLLQHLLQKALGEEESNGWLHSLLEGLDVVSARPAQELWELAGRIRSSAAARSFADPLVAPQLEALRRDPDTADIAQAIDEYLARWGFRGAGELMLTQPNLEEDPAPLLALLRSQVNTPTEAPATRQADRRAHRQSRKNELGRALRERLGAVRGRLAHRAIARVLRWTQSSIPRRERARLKQAALYQRLRAVLRELGARLQARGVVESADDLFLLEWRELESLLAGGARAAEALQERLRRRRAQQAALPKAPPPEDLDLRPGEHRGASATDHDPVPPLPDHHDDANTLRGTAASAGSVRAPAAVVADLREADQVRSGDVLVTQQTDPGWVHVFFLLEGLVLERGGMLSHGAILAREYGIPTVVGVRDATRRIQHGQSIQVDGDRGHVHVD